MRERALELSRKAAAVFEERGIRNGRLEAELLLADVLGVKRLDLYLQYDRPLTAEELERFRSAVRRRLRREPLQYILGTAAFRGLELRVDPRVLIPRPETEVLVGAVLEWATSHKAHTVLDLGTGSGAIALALAEEGGFERIVATDVSREALDVARENARLTGLADGVEFRCGALFDPVGDERFDIIVSNPPYIGESERNTLEPDVREHEPAAALFAGPDGLEVIDALVAGAPAHLEAGGLLAMEIGATQAERVLGRVVATGGYGAARVMTDLAGRQRIVLAERASR